MNRIRFPFLSCAVLALLAFAGSAGAATFSDTLQAGPTNSIDTELREGEPTSNFGTDGTIRVSASKLGQRRNTLVDFTLPDLTGRTVLSAWLRLYHFDGEHPKAFPVRVFPVTEAWDEATATWNQASTGVPWTTPGGTRDSHWSDRRVLSRNNDGTFQSWQVGPILQAYQTGAFGISGGGFLLEGDTSPPTRAQRFHASEYVVDTTRTPVLELVTTDEPPAVFHAVAELRPKEIFTGIPGNPLRLLIEVDQGGVTPSGTPTGFDEIVLLHGGLISISSVEQVVAGGTIIPSGSLSWTDDGSALVVQLPGLTSGSVTVEMDFRANVLGGSIGDTRDLHAFVRNTASGAGRQSVWPGNADMIPGNGDNLALTFLTTGATGFAVRTVSGPAQVFPGETGVPLSVSVENVSTDQILVSSVSLTFSRALLGDANPEFIVVPDPANPETLEVGELGLFNFLVDVVPTAANGTISVDAQGSGALATTGQVVGDADADTLLSLEIPDGSFEVSALQPLQDPVLPGATGVALLQVELVNGQSGPRVLQELTAANTSQGPGTQAQLDAQLGTLSLWTDDGDGVFDPADDTEIVSGRTATGGAVRFTGVNLNLAADGTTRVHVVTDLPLVARDGDRLDLALVDDTALVWDGPATYTNSWPQAPAGSRLIDGMAAAQIVVFPVAARNLLPDATDELAFDFILPANGYEADQLLRLDVENLGTATDMGEVAALRLWSDAGAAGFDPLTDQLLGELEFTGSRWEITGLTSPIPVGGHRFFITADVGSDIVAASTVRLSIPTGEQFGVSMVSGNSGPRDDAVSNPEALTVTTQNRIVLLPEPLAGGIAAPGETGRVLLKISASNSYAVTKTLTRLDITNGTQGPGSGAERDAEVERVALHVDGNGNGLFDDPVTDPPLASGVFSGGRFSANPLDRDILPGETCTLFVLGDVALGGARDGDRLAATVETTTDIDFSDPTTVAAIWPVSSGGSWEIDGHVAGQLLPRSAGSVTLGPGDGPATALDLWIPGNGYEADTFTGLRIVNLGDADDADLEELHLWRDGGDGFRSADDIDLGQLAWTGSAWQSLLLSEAVPASGARVYVDLTVSAAFADSATVDLAVPVNGLTYASANDGPRDAAVSGDRPALLSAAPLLATLSIDPGSATVGQTVTVSMVLENRGSETIQNIAPTALAAGGTGVLTQVGGPTPAVLDLAPGAIDSLQWTYRADAAGPAWLSGSAAGTGQTTSLPRAAVGVRSNAVQVFVPAVTLGLSPLDTMPLSVSLGQSDVVPMTLTFTHPGPDGVSDIEVTRIRFRLEDEFGNGIVPADLLSRVVISEGQTIFGAKTVLETSGSQVDMVLGAPLGLPHVGPGDPVSVSLRLDIAPVSPVSRFRVVIPGAAHIEARDANSGNPVALQLGSGSFPVQTSISSLVVSQATEVQVTGVAPQVLRVGPGQGPVDLLEFSLASVSPGAQTSPARIARMAFSIADTAGVPLADVASVLDRLEVVAGIQTVFDAAVNGAGDSVVVNLTPPIAVLESNPVTVVLRGDITPSAVPGNFRISPTDPNSFLIVDANTGNRIPAVYQSPPPVGRPVIIELPATALDVSGAAQFPARLSVGDTDVDAFDLTLAHPGGPGVEAIRVDSFEILLRDDRGQTLTPGSVLDRLRVHNGFSDVAVVTSFPSTPGAVLVHVDLVLNPGSTIALTVAADIDAAAPVGYVQLETRGDGILALGDNLNQPVIVRAATGATLPVVSGLTQLQSPARELQVGLASSMPAALTADGSAFTVGSIGLSNTEIGGSGAIELTHVDVVAADGDFSPLAVGDAVTSLEILVNGAPLATATGIAAGAGSAQLAFTPNLVIDGGETITLELRAVARGGGTLPGFRLGVEESGLGVVQPGGGIFTIAVRPEDGAFPVWTELGSFSVQDLGASYSNFPNPFRAGRENTTFVYYLPSSGRVSLRMWTAQGDEVAVLLDDEPRSSGLHQSDLWNGRNGRGSEVVNGVYIAELVVAFDDGSRRRLLRKVAVVR